MSGPQFIDNPTNQNVSIKPRTMIFNKFNINLKSFILQKPLDTFKNFINNIDTIIFRDSVYF